MSQLKFWNKQNNSSKTDSSENTESKNGTATKEETKGGKRNWLHTPEALINGHVVYLVKFFGSLPVDQPKGIEVVKDTIRKLQFAQQMKKAETGTQEKCKKVEITISVDGVAVQEPRTQKILHQFPLHNISYCADEKGVKKFFSFIAKTIKTKSENMSNGRGSSPDYSTQSAIEETHECFLFISNKLASDITLTIGQAFELAFRKYINTTEKSELSKAQQQITDLEKIITIYKNRLRELALKIPKNDMDTYLFREGIKDIAEVHVATTQIATMTTATGESTNSSSLTNGTNGLSDNNDRALLIDTNSCNTSNKMSTTSSNAASASSFLPAVPPRSSMPTQLLSKTMNNNNNQKMEELLLNSDSDSDFDPRAEESNTDGNSTSSGGKAMTNDLFGFEPSTSFGQQLFYNNNDSKFLNINNSNNNHSNTNSCSILSNNSNNSFTELTITPPLLAPPPKLSTSRRSTPTTTMPSSAAAISNNIVKNGNMADLFGSDPFDTTATANGTGIFQNHVTKISVDDFTLESLDPLRK